MNRQPNFRTRIRRSALSEGLVFAAYPIGPTYVDVVSGAVAGIAGFPFTPTPQVVFANGGACRSGEWGSAPLPDNNNSSGFMFPRGATGVDYLLNGGTLLALAGCTGTANQFHPVFGSQEDFNGTQAILWIDDNGFQGPGQPLASLKTGLFGGPAGNANMLTSDPKNKLHFFGFGWDTTTIYWYGSGNGLQRSTSASGGTVPSTPGDNARITTICRPTNVGSGYGFQNYTALALAWNRPLSLPEYVFLWANPWQLFEVAEQRVYSFATTATNSGVGSSTGSSTAHAVAGSIGAATGTSTMRALAASVATAAGASTAQALAAALAQAAGSSAVNAIAGATARANGAAGDQALAGSIAHADGASIVAAVYASIGQASGTASDAALSGSVAHADGTSAAQAEAAGSNTGVGGAEGASVGVGMSGAVARAVGAASASGVTGSIGRASGVADARALIGSLARADAIAVDAALAGYVARAAGTSTVRAVRGSVARAAGVSHAAAQSNAVVITDQYFIARSSGRHFIATADGRAFIALPDPGRDFE